MRRGVRLRGAVVVITGASSGIGRATARRFAEKGAHVVLAARGADSLDDAAAECRTAGGGRVLAVPTDVADVDAVEDLARRAVVEFGRIDVWVNNAAVMSYGEVGDVPDKVQRRIVEVNLFGTMYGARAALPVMKKQGKGVIINVASLYAKMVSPYVSPYATSKFGVLGFSEVLRQEVKPARGIRVCTVLPGSMDTPIFRNAANYTGRAVKPIPPVSSPYRVVRAIVRRAQHPRYETNIGVVHTMASWGDALLPRLYSALAPRAMRLLALGNQEVPHTDGNVFEPIPERAAVEGGWRDWRRRLVGGVLGLAAVAVAVVIAGARSREGRRVPVAALLRPVSVCC